jgi:SH3-like domain-containing protein
MSMKRPLSSLVVASALALSAAGAQAMQFNSVSEPALLYETPSAQGRKLFIISPGTPVEVVVELDQWVKVRDPSGSINWIERRSLRNERTVMVTAQKAVARQSPDGSAGVSFEAGRNVVLDLIGSPSNGWVQVRHREGVIGYLRATEVWGL